MHATRVYRLLLCLYPASYRESFAKEMTLVFGEASAEVEDAQWAVRIRFYTREGLGLLHGAVRERVRAATGIDTDPFRRFRMGRDYRFPKSTALLMCLILAGVIVAIIRATEIEMHYGPAILTVWPSLPWTVGLMLLIALLGAAIVLGVMFGLQRSGVQRLENLQSWPERK